MGEYLQIGYLAVDGFVSGVDQRCRLRDDVASGAAAIHLLDGLADGASYSVIVEVPIDRRSFGQSSRYQRDRVVTSLAMPGVLDSLSIPKHIRILEVPRSTECVCVSSL